MDNILLTAIGGFLIGWGLKGLITSNKSKND